MSEQPMSADQAKIHRATARLAQLQAASALRAMRQSVRARTRERREQAQRRGQLADAVMAAGLSDWSKEEVLGLLLAGLERFGQSETARKMFQMRATGEPLASPSVH